MTRNFGGDGLNGPLKDHSQSPIILKKPSSHPSTVFSYENPKWNTKQLPWRVTSDITAAACASGLVAPAITMIDRAIIERASNRSTIGTSLLNSAFNLLTRPHRFLASKPTLLISLLYFSTYTTANTIDTLNSTLSNKPASTVTPGPAKFLATTSVNMSLCLYKDSQFAKMFGAGPSGGATGAATRAIPAISYALFALRDSLTIFASFNLPPLIAPVVPISEEIGRHVSRANIAQFVAPAAIQLLSTPLHLWGLDLYNRPMGNGTPWRSRLRRVGRDWFGSSLARMGRIVPAFGVGGVVNSGVRRTMIGEDL